MILFDVPYYNVKVKSYSTLSFSLFFFLVSHNYTTTTTSKHAATHNIIIENRLFLPTTKDRILRSVYSEYNISECNIRVAAAHRRCFRMFSWRVLAIYWHLINEFCADLHKEHILLEAVCVPYCTYLIFSSKHFIRM